MAGQFVGRVRVEWLEHGGKDRDMRLLDPFGFVDASGTKWDVPAGAVVNGASIPRVFWTSFGPPFVGDYRRASVVHDHYCVTKDRHWKAVHRMFEEGCRVGGVSKVKSKAMYLAVRNFGPRWSTATETVILPEGAPIPEGAAIDLQPDMSEDDFESLIKWIEESNPSLDEIDERSDEAVRVMLVPPTG